LGQFWDKLIHCKHKPIYGENHNNVLFLETLFYLTKSVNIKI